MSMEIIASDYWYGKVCIRADRADLLNSNFTRVRSR